MFSTTYLQSFFYLIQTHAISSQRTQILRRTDTSCLCNIGTRSKPCGVSSSSSSSIYYLSLRCNKIHTIHKNNLQKQNKNNFFHDRRLEGTCYGHLVKQPPIMHLFAHKSFRLTSIGSYCYQRDIMRQF